MKISLKNVGYEYPTFENNKNGIYNVSLEIASHKRIAIVLNILFVISYVFILFKVFLY